MRRRKNDRHPRSGSTLIIAILALVMISAIGVSLVRYSLLAREQISRTGWEQQSRWLAESAVAKLTAESRSGPIESDEWTIENIGLRNQSGRIEIIASAVESDRQPVTIIADFPADKTDRVRTSRKIEILISETTPDETSTTDHEKSDG